MTDEDKAILMDASKKFLKELGFDFPVKIEFTNQIEADEELGSKPCYGHFCGLRDNISNILLVDYLPLTETFIVLRHELGHAIDFNRGYPKFSSSVCGTHYNRIAHQYKKKYKQKTLYEAFACFIENEELDIIKEKLSE